MHFCNSFSYLKYSITILKVPTDMKYCMIYLPNQSFMKKKKLTVRGGYFLILREDIP